METNFITIEQMFDEYDRSIISKRSFLSLQGFIMTLLGVIAFSIEPLLSENNEMLFAATMMIGLALSIWGIIKLFIGKSYYMYHPTMSKIYFEDLYFEQDKLNEIVDYLSKNQFDKISQYSCKLDKGLKIRIAYTKNQNYSAFQILKFVPYEYKPFNKIKEIFEDNLNSEIQHKLKLK